MNKIEIRDKRRRERRIVGHPQWYRIRYEKLKASARKRGFIFELSHEDHRKIFDTPLCHYCEEANVTRSVDRKDNSMGYTVNNCVMACWKCNQMKGILLPKDKERILKIVAKAL